MAFSVLLSLVDKPLHSAQPRATDRRTSQMFARQTSRELVKGRGTLRVAAFGSSNMWGAGLENRFDALPYLLSDEVDNYAMFSGGPNYPAVCTETIVGDDDVYDVIFLEYWLKARQGVPELARRLRARFPHAMIFFVKIWSPLHARRRGKDGEGELTFEDWRNSRFSPNEQINIIINALEADDGDWYFPEHPDAEMAITEARQSVDGYYIRILQKETGKETLMFFLHFFNQQSAQLSKLGHEYLANITKTTIKKKLEVEATTVSDLVNSVEYGDWGRGDSCHMWYTTGGYTSEFSPELVMREFDPHLGKFALEVTAPGWVVVRNDFEDERTLFVSFLATIEGFYPEAIASIGETGAPTLLVPVNPDDHKGSHNPRTIAIGKIPPGDSKIFITPQGSTGTFFRLVGLSLTDEIAVPEEFGFGPLFNH